MLDFKIYIQNIRKTSIQRFEKYLKNEYVKVGLEVGAGDGYQSRILVEYLEKLVVTEYDKGRLQQIEDNRIIYIIADAEAIENSLSIKTFDFIFSSHLLEHLPNPEKLIQSSFNLIGKNGTIIHIVPSSWFAFFRLIFYYPSIFTRFIKKIKRKGSINLFLKSEQNAGNNLKTDKKSRRKILEFLYPRPHGISKSAFGELFNLSKKSWIKLFNENHLEIVEIINGECFSGYGFGLEKCKKFLSKLGIACEYIYVLRPKKHD